MAIQGTKIVEMDVQKLIKDLNRAYCDEWLAFYSYLHMARNVSGFGYEDMDEFLKKTAMNEFEHTAELSERIVQLGGTPVAAFGMIEKNSNVPFPMPPEKTNDYSAIIATVLNAEAGAIDVYNKILKDTFGKDAVTYQLITHILAEEVEHEERFENLKAAVKETEPSLKRKPEPSAV